MGTIRVARRRRYTSIDRRAINDRALSFRARGILHWLLDKPDDWSVRSEAIANESAREGREAVRTALTELEAAGYLVRRRVQGPDGRWATETTVYEDPADAPPADVAPAHTEAQDPDAGSPDVGSPDVGALGALPLEGLRPTTDTPPCPPEGEEEPPGDWTFAAFWGVYPRRVGKAAAERAWAKAIKRAPRWKIIRGARLYAEERADVARRRGQAEADRFTAHPATWLNAGRWDDEPTVADQGRDRGVDTDRTRASGLLSDDEF